MFALTNKPEMAAHLYSDLVALASDKDKGVDSMVLIQLIAGIMVETALVFEKPDEALCASLNKLYHLMGAEPMTGALSKNTLPPAHIIDRETERGRAAARSFFEDWLDCTFEFHDLMSVITHNVFVYLENEGQHRAESLRLLHECAHHAMFFEIAAQELCDVVIEYKVAQENWALSDCIASLSAISGRCLAMSLDTALCKDFKPTDLPDNLDRVVYVMTQEAVRLGVPAGSDWRFGLPANDVPVDAPYDLIYSIEPYCASFFAAIQVQCQYVQSVACAKAAGRMLAVAAGGEVPEMEPAIAKPLAMAAITETYKSICVDRHIISC